MTKTEARLIETLAGDAWIALANSDGAGASALVREVRHELGAPGSKLKEALRLLELRIVSAALIVSRIRQAAREELEASRDMTTDGEN